MQRSQAALMHPVNPILEELRCHLTDELIDRLSKLSEQPGQSLQNYALGLPALARSAGDH